LRILRFASLLAAALLFTSSSLLAQDTRKVTEPVIPSSCVTLNANIAAPRGVIALADEQKLDTERIQHALDTAPLVKP